MVKSYRVRTEKIRTADIITTGIQIVLENSSENVQKKKEMKPVRCTNDVIQSVHQQMFNEIEKANESFRMYRFKFLQHILHVLRMEKNEVSEKIKELSVTIHRVCSNEACEKMFNSLKRKCDSCGSLVVKRTPAKVSQHQSPYHNFGEVDIGQCQNSETRPQIKMSDPVLLNPNSYKNLETILTEMKQFANIGKDREWVFLGCDGPPYCLSERIIESNPEKFEFASLVPGLGHLHMNQMKTIFKVMEDIILEPLGKEVLNFQSVKAYQFFIDAKDTHKSWQALQVLLFGTGLELARAYKEEDNPDECTVLGFLQWQSNHVNPTIQLLTQLIFNYVLAIYLFKIGVRHNDVHLINASCLKFDDLFYVFNHPIYREIEYRDLRNRVMYPKEVRRIRDSNMSFSTTTLPGKSQGGDFILEGKVKRQKLIAPKGPVKGETWKVLSRSLDGFDEIYSSVSEKLKLRDPDATRNVDLGGEIITWRAVLRSSEYLLKGNFSGTSKNIYGESLSEDMANLSQNASNKRKTFWQIIESGENIANVKYNLLRVLPGKDVEDMMFVEDEEDC